MPTREIVVEKLVKKYPGDVTAVDDISFEVNAGEVFGFLGPNGAGKSITIKILTTFALPTAGNAKAGRYYVPTPTYSHGGIYSKWIKTLTMHENKSM